MADEDQGSKLRRSTRACLQCRSRKQRCHGESDIPAAPCQRCRTSGKTCSFETEEVPRRFHPYPFSSSKIVDDLQTELAEHKARLEALEKALGLPTTSKGKARDDFQSSPSSSSDLQKAPKKPFTMTGVSLGAPITTLRNLGNTLAEDEEDYSQSPSSSTAQNGLRSSGNMLASASPDPVSAGIISLEDSQRLFDIFFHNCHPLAPLMCIRSQSNASQVRNSSPLLFTAICSIGARYWNHHASHSTESWLHPRYAEIIDILDQSIVSQLLRPTTTSMSIESVQAMLLYAQWMPLEVSKPASTSSGSTSRSRFNDVSAWTVIGIAIRQASFLGLDRAVDAPFHSPTDVTDQDMKKMRVWMNLLSIDHHLTLTARLPATLDPAPAARVARAFGSHPRAEPTDLKAAGLCELVAIIHRAAKFCGDASLCALDRASLNKANAELDEWESVWTVVFSTGGFLHFNTQMPFTALRWYRLGLNVVSLGPAFFGRTVGDQPSPVTLRTGVKAATSMLYCFSASEAFTIDTAALARFRYSIDAYWITHAFAVVFLALAYDRGVIDQDLNVLMPSTQVSLPGPPRETSVLYRLIRLATDIFDCAATHPPAAYYREIVLNTFQALMQPPQPPNGGDGGNIFTMIMEDGFDWTFNGATFGLAGPPLSM